MPEKRKPRYNLVIWEIYKDFAQNTSIHGLKYTVESGISIYEKFFWVFVLLLGLIGSGYMTILVWNRYISSPIRTSIHTSYAPISTIPFPAITICNVNHINEKKLDNFIKRLNVNTENETIIRRALPQLLALILPFKFQYNFTELKILERILYDNYYYDIKFVMKTIFENCHDMFVKCHWEYNEYDCNDLFKTSLTPDGFCCSFNYALNSRSSVLYTNYSGFHSGLIVLINIDSSNIFTSYDHSILTNGLRVHIHHPFDYPNFDSTSKILSKGRLNFLQIIGKKLICSQELHALPLRDRHLIFSKERSLDYFDSYDDSNCETLCLIMKYYQKCKCVPFYFDFVDKPICNISDILCLDATKRSLESKNEDTCDCPSQCEDDLYNVITTSTELYANNSFRTASFLEDINVSENHTHLVFYFLQETHTIILRDPVTSMTYLLSSFGGVFGLFLGCSFITIIEIIYYCFIRFLVVVKILNKQHPIPIIKLKKQKQEQIHHKKQLHQQLTFLN